MSKFTREELMEMLRALPLPDPSPEDWVCSECGSDELHAPAWVDLRTDLNTGDEGPTSYYYCVQCEDSISRIVQRKDYVPDERDSFDDDELEEDED